MGLPESQMHAHVIHIYLSFFIFFHALFCVFWHVSFSASFSIPAGTPMHGYTLVGTHLASEFSASELASESTMKT